ncbi:MAG: cobalamin B12-binding domain-containing protein, partial [Magnetospirillum sp.]|nr:cobalamin B12-binding domain-containing protein [Magnetospirillum sp.]
MSRLRRVLLVDPGQSFAEGGSRHATRQTPHIGLACLASVARRIADVQVLDMPLMGANDEDLRLAVQDFQAGDIVGITTATFNLPEALDAARVVKEVNPAIVTLVGGPHVNAFPADVPQRSGHVDAAVVGEGERILEHVILNHGKPGFDWDIPGVATWGGDAIRYRPPSVEWVYDNLDDLPLPDWEFLGLGRYWKRYSSRFDRMEQLAPLSTIRGC